MDQNVASMLLQLLAGNAQPMLTAMAAGPGLQAPAVALANPPSVLPTPPVAPPSSSHPSLTQPPSVPPPLPSASAAPPIQPYRSLRTAPSSLPTQLPPLPQLSSSSAPLNSVVNQARLAHAASSLPRPPARSRRRPRTNATALPGLPRVPDIASCMTHSRWDLGH